MPVHIVFLELIIDPACSIAYEAEPEEADLMARPPRAANTPLFGTGEIIFSLLQGLISLVGIIFVFGWSLYRGNSDELVRTLTFATLVLCMVGLIFLNRSRSQIFWSTLSLPNRAFWWVVAGALGFLAAVIYVPSASEIFRFTPIGWNSFMVPLTAGALVVVCLEIAKTYFPKDLV